MYTQLLDRRGGIQADLTVTRLAADRFLLVTGTAFGNHDAALAAVDTCRDDGSVAIRDVTSSRVCFGLWGPRARDILAPLTRDDVSDAGFPYLTAREITRRVGAGPGAAGHLRRRARLGAVRPDRVRPRALVDASGRPGAAHGLVAGGYRAIEALRLEKGYRVWSSDITPGRDAVRGRSRVRRRARQGASPSLAHDALVAAKAAGPRKRLRCLVLDDPLDVCLGNEPVRVDGEIVGRVTSGG